MDLLGEGEGLVVVVGGGGGDGMEKGRLFY